MFTKWRFAFSHSSRDIIKMRSFRKKSLICYHGSVWIVVINLFESIYIFISKCDLKSYRIINISRLVRLRKIAFINNQTNDTLIRQKSVFYCHRKSSGLWLQWTLLTFHIQLYWNHRHSLLVTAGVGYFLKPSPKASLIPCQGRRRGKSWRLPMWLTALPHPGCTWPVAAGRASSTGILICPERSCWLIELACHEGFS